MVSVALWGVLFGPCPRGQSERVFACDDDDDEMIAAASAMVLDLPTLNAAPPLPTPLHVHLQILPTPLSPTTISEQRLPSCPPTHLYAPRAPPTIHLPVLPPTTPYGRSNYSLYTPISNRQLLS